VQKIEGTEIGWKAGKDVTVKVTKKKGKGGKGKGPAKTIVKEEPLPSFFRFFDTPDLEHGADATEEDVSICVCLCVCMWRVACGVWFACVARAPLLDLVLFLPHPRGMILCHMHGFHILA
jgi:hypothetical protein